MKKFILVFILVSAGILLFRYALQSLPKDDFVKHLNRWNVRIDTARLTLADFSESNSGGLDKETIEAQKENMILKMTRTKTNAPGKYIGDRKFLLESLFSPTTSPYPEVITNVIECPEEFKPKAQELKNGTIYTLFAGERFTYGICAEDLVAYYSAYGIFDCKEKGIFEVRAFSKTEEAPKAIASSFGC